MKHYDQKSIYDSPWSFREKVGIFLWDYGWLFLCAWVKV